MEEALAEEIVAEARRHPVNFGFLISGRQPHLGDESAWLGGDVYKRRRSLSRREYCQSIAALRHWARPRLNALRPSREARAAWTRANRFRDEYFAARARWAPGAMFGEALATAIEDALAYFGVPLKHPDILAHLRGSSTM